MINTKGNIWITGFDTIEDKNDKLRYLFHVSENMASELIYAGKTSDIPEEIAKDLCNWTFWDETPERRRYYNYGKRIVVSYPFLTAKGSIQSACNQEYCIIFKK